MAQDSDYIDPSNSNKNNKSSTSKGKSRRIDSDSDSDSDLEIELDGLDSEDELLLSNKQPIYNSKKRKLNNNNNNNNNNKQHNGVNGKGSSRKNGNNNTIGKGGLGKSKDQGYAWEATFKRSWEAVQEDEGGSLANSVKKLLEGNRRNRTLQDSSPVQRGIIRHLVLIIDLSEAMNEKDLRPNRHELTLSYASAFVSEYFDQNPIGQLSILGTRSGISERLLPMGGNIVEALTILSSKRKLEPKGEPSLQNSLEMAQSSLSHLPISNTREILFLFGSLTTCDPGNIHETLEGLIKDKIKVNFVCLSAEIRICKKISEKTGGKFGVVLNEDHFKDLIMKFVNPPEIQAETNNNKREKKTNEKRKRFRNDDDVDDDDDSDDDDEKGLDLMQMGFPLKLSSTSNTNPNPNPDSNSNSILNSSLCSCHSKLKSQGYKCPRCGVKFCQIPTDCSVCGLTVVLSTHLARSYHHLFPVGNFKGVDWNSLKDEISPNCFSCSIPFPKPTKYHSISNGLSSDHHQRSRNGNVINHGKDKNSAGTTTTTTSIDEISPTSRYRCKKCLQDFCLECDGFVHEVLFSCPGCC